VKTPFLPLQKAVTGLAQRRMMESLVRMWGSVLLQEGKKDVQGVGTPGEHGEAGGNAFMPPGVGTRRFCLPSMGIF
jgi:hypothetical protein